MKKLPDLKNIKNNKEVKVVSEKIKEQRKYRRKKEDFYKDNPMPETHKFLGYCPKKSCGSMVMSTDLVTKFIYICISCGKRARISTLKSERDNGNRNPNVKSKKDYLSDSIGVGFNDVDNGSAGDKEEES